MLASLTTLIAGIARLPLRADHLGGLEAPQPGQGGAAAQERSVNREGVVYGDRRLRRCNFTLHCLRLPFHVF